MSPLLITLVTSPDFRSTPTIDQGLGLGRGLGLGPTGGEDSSMLLCGKADLGLASGEGEDFFSRLVNLLDRGPSMEPPPLLPVAVAVFVSFSMVSSPLFERSFGANSLVGDVKLAAKPVDLKID